MRQALVFVVLLGCGASSSGATIRPPDLDPSDSEISGVTVMVRPRAGSGHVVAALFVRVRAEPPALATTAALVLEERSRGRLVARATADGIALRAASTATELESVVAALGAAIAARDVSPEEVARAVERVRARRAGRARDDRATAARLAVAAMFGSETDALGTGSDDDALTAAAVNQLLRAHFGAERALVAVVGDVSRTSVDVAVSRAFADAAHVDPRGSSSARLGRDVRAEISDEDVVAVARRVPDMSGAAAVRAWVEWADPAASVSAFPLHGAAVVLAVRRGGARDAEALVARMQRASELDEGSFGREATDAEGELLGLGDAWLARGEASGDGLGVGLVVAGGRDDDLDGSRDERVEALRSAMLASLGDTRAERVGLIDEATADQTLVSGLRVRVRRVVGGTLAVAIAFEGGASLDPRAEHGRAALLASMLGQSCEPDADLTWVDARSMGLVISGERTTLAATVARAIDCVRGATRETGRAEGVRADAIAVLDDSTRQRAWAARAIAPGTPGLVAPLGSATGIAAASGLDGAIRSMFVPNRATIVIIGDVDPARAVAVADALASELGPRGETRRAPPGAVADADVFVADPLVSAPEVIVTLRSDVGASVAAARSTARALAAALREEGAAVQFWFGDAARGASFVAVGVRGDPALLDTLPGRMSSRYATLDARSGLDEAIASEERRRALASPLDLAREIASEVEVGDPLEVVRGLLSATPRYVMLRPSASPMHPSRRR